MNLFGKKKLQVVQPIHAISKLQETQSMLEKRESHLDKQIAELKNNATRCMKAKNTARALYFIKKAKILEKQLETTFNMKLNIETQISVLSQSITNIETITAIQSSKDAFSFVEKKLDPDNVAELMDDIAENMNKVEEVADSLGQSIGPVVDEDELLKELEENFVEKSLVEIPDIKAVKNTLSSSEEKELKELELIMNI